MRWKTAAIAAGSVAVLGAGAMAMRGEAASAPNAAPQTVEAERRDLVVRAEAAGEVEPIRTVEVKSKASGEVLKVYVETGDYVEAGTLLAEIDPRDVQSSLAQAGADLESARVQLSTSSAQRQRVEALRRSEVVTQQEYEAAVDAEASARAAVVRAQTSYRLATERSKDVTIRAPIAGTIITRTVEPGQVIASATSNVSGGTSLFTMADLREIQVRALVDETDIGRVSSGQDARVTVEAYPGRTFRGAVRKVEPQAVVEQNVTMFPVLVHLANEEGLLKPGMNAEVSMETARRAGAVSVPTGAVTTPREAGNAAKALGLDADSVRAALRGGAAGGESRRGRRGAGSTETASAGDAGGRREVAATGEGTPGIVFVATARGPEARRVTTGLSDWENVEVTRGLNAGERVYLVNTALLQQEQKESADRFRQRAGGVVPGAGGGAGGGRRGG